MDSPEQILEVRYLSTSLVSRERNQTYGNFGFILGGVRANHLRATSGTDMGTHHSLFLAWGYRFRFPVMTPERLLESTPSNSHMLSYNEILLAQSRASPFYIQGIFLRVNEAGVRTCTAQEWTDANSLASRLRVPLIYLGP